MHTLRNDIKTPTYKYYSIGEKSRVPAEQVERSYLYIGLHSEDYPSLKTEFSSGFTRDCLEKGISFLDQCAEDQKVSVIFIDLPFCFTSLHVFLTEKDNRKKLSDVPVILNIRNLTPEQVAVVRKKKMADELVDFKVEMASIKEKIAFLQVIRASISEKQDSIRVEQNPSSIYPDTFFLKRTLDIMLSSVLLFVLSPVFMIIALAIKLESRGPVFYNSYRAGRGYNIFKLYHFRTMKVGADRMLNSFLRLNKFNNFGHAPVQMRIENDPRITRVGHFLLKSGLYKLPSLINVLIGNMAIIGNNPLYLYEATSLTSNETAERFAGPTGLTGLWRFTGPASAKSDGKIVSTEVSELKKKNVLTELVSMFNTPIESVQTYFSKKEEVNNENVKRDLAQA